MSESGILGPPLQQLDDLLDLVFLQLVEDDHLVDAVEELGPEDPLFSSPVIRFFVSSHRMAQARAWSGASPTHGGGRSQSGPLVPPRAIE